MSGVKREDFIWGVSRRGKGEGLLYTGFVEGHIAELDAGTAQEFDAVGQPVLLGIYDASDAGLDDEFATLDAGRVGHVERGPVGIVARTGDLGDGIGLGVEDIGLRQSVLVFADVFKTGGGTVITVADDHLVFDDQCTNLAPGAV